MKSLLGVYLRQLRGDQSRLQFAKRLGLSYTFVREMELGNRLPSDGVLLELAASLQADPRRLLLYAYSDRSPPLRKVLQENDVAGLWDPEPSPGKPEAP
jgi:transcriptional regulator with XRE-family HTH domain